MEKLYRKRYFWIYASGFFCALFFVLDEFFLFWLSYFPLDYQLLIHRSALFTIVAIFIGWNQWALKRFASMNQKMVDTAKLATLGEMAAMIAHEIIRPLTIIDLNTQVVMFDAGSSSKLKEFCRTVSEQLDRAKSTINSLRSFSKESNSSQKEEYDINLILEKSLELTKPYLQFTSVDRALDTQSPIIKCNEHQIEQVISNLLINAKDALPSNAASGITVRSLLDKNELIIEIEDAGKGISELDLERIFDPFYTSKENGTGLGLAISHRIIKEHKGTLTVSSIPGKTSFQIRLPGRLGTDALKNIDCVPV